MKITAITTHNYLGALDIGVHLSKPVTLFCGANFSGKSSLREAVKHALTGECTRIELKKDYAHLLTDGQKSGHAIVQTDEGKAAITLPGGKHEITFAPPESLPYVIDAQRFAHLDENSKRAFLFGLMGLSASGESVRKALVKRGCAAERIEAVMPLLRSGFDAAHQEAKSRARDAKAAWRAVTNEVYGSQKAPAWRAAKPTVDEKKLKHAQAALEEADRALAENQRKLGALEAQAEQVQKRNAKLAALRQRASQYHRYAAKLVIDEKQLAQWEQAVASTSEKASGAPAIEPLACPECGASLVLSAEGQLQHYQAAANVADTEAADKLPSYIEARDLYRRSVANDRVQLEDADAAAKAIVEIEDEAKAAPAPSADEIADLRHHIEAIKASRKGPTDDIAQLSKAKLEADTAAERDRNATAHHQDVLAWESIAEALAPDGIPGTLLKGALNPINARIDESAEFTAWLPITIGADMSITSNGRDYRMLSESEKWRADALIAEAISHLSGLRLLVLDRVDVLDLIGRADLVAWLDQWAQDAEIDTALLFATLKKPPSLGFANVDVQWIEQGAINNEQARKAA